MRFGSMCLSAFVTGPAPPLREPRTSVAVCEMPVSPNRRQSSSTAFVGSQFAYSSVCVTSKSAGGVSAAEYVGRTSGQLDVRTPGKASRQLSSVERRVQREYALSSVASGQSRFFDAPIEAGSAKETSAEATPRNTLPRVLKRQRQAASSSVFQCMRRRFATP